jgi:hypothetical protein
VLFAALTVVRFSLVTIALLAGCVYVVWQVTHREKRAKELSTTREQAMVWSGAGRPPVRLPFFSSELARFRLMLCPGHNFSSIFNLNQKKMNTGSRRITEILKEYSLISHQNMHV